MSDRVLVAIWAGSVTQVLYRTVVSAVAGDLGEALLCGTVLVGIVGAWLVVIQQALKEAGL